MNPSCIHSRPAYQSASTFNSEYSNSQSVDFQHSTPNTCYNHVTTCASTQGPRAEDTTPSFHRRPSTPPYILRESTRINALESTVQQMASDLTSSKEQIKEVKDLLLRLINPATPYSSHGASPTPSHAPYQPLNHPSPPPAHQEQRTVTNGLLQRSNAVGNVRSGIHVQTVDDVAEVTPDGLCPSPTAVPMAQEKSPSWMSGDTVPVTPNTMLQNFSNRMPIGAAVSTEVSASIGTGSHDISPRQTAGTTDVVMQRRPPQPSSHAVQSVTPAGDLQDDSTTHDGVATRRMTSQVDPVPVRAPRLRLELTLQPRFTSHALAANSLCYILHPDHGNTVVGEGRTGGSWKCRSGKYGSLCSEGEQMLQIHKLIKTGLPLVFVEGRQPFTTMDQALVKPSGSSVYVKWLTRLLWSRKKV
ncbi:hypothetical protein KC19_12G103400 [Ceratodon purpureus]|uniref:Uncharacterized protein n=1 Tax=Ceratodon purpureus TaxID=3225 RepID=A0A8T0G6X8_CERPU|nr:hypothetical protein KC19_12G103400 [Ceratodon purpureus]